MVAIRLATLADVDALVRMRWDFSQEENPHDSAVYESFSLICTAFLQKALTGGDWHIWVAERDGNIVSHMYLQLVHKVPRPGQAADPYFAYVTNVYTRPGYRSQGIGRAIHRELERWAAENHVEFLLLWPSEKSVAFYERMVLHVAAKRWRSIWARKVERLYCGQVRKGGRQDGWLCAGIESDDRDEAAIVVRSERCFV